jgi:hypothetical protein
MVEGELPAPSESVTFSSSKKVSNDASRASDFRVNKNHFTGFHKPPADRTSLRLASIYARDGGPGIDS